VPRAIAIAKTKIKVIFYFFRTKKPSKIHNFHIIDPNTMKECPCTPPHQGVSDGMKNTTGGRMGQEISI